MNARATSRIYRLRVRYNLTEEGYRRLQEQQGGVCFICAKACSSGRKLAVDHDHSTGKVRGLLCRRCNQMLGVAKDDPTLLLRAADYLLKGLLDGN